MNKQYNNPHSLRGEEYKQTMDIVESVIDMDEHKEENADKKQLTASEATLGRKIRHGKFGIGTIISVAKDGRDIKLTIVFDKMGVKTFMLGVAPLELL